MTISDEIEQLKRILEQTADEREQAALLIEQLKKYASISSTETRPAIDHLLALAEKLNSNEYRAWGLHYMALLNSLKGNNEQALTTAKQALTLFKELKINEGIAICYNVIGGIFDNRGNYPEALKIFFAGLRLREELGDKTYIAKSYINIGNIYFRQDNFAAALDSYSSALKLAEETNNKQALTAAHLNLGGVYTLTENYPEALKNYSAALQLAEQTGDKKVLAYAYNNFGNINANCGNYAEALKNHFSALNLSEEIGHKASIADSNSYIGVVYKKQGDYEAALKHHLAAIKTGEETGGKEVVKKSCLEITDVYVALHDFENALRFNKKYIEIEKEILGNQAQIQLANLNFQHHMEQKEKDLEIEQLRNVELKKERDRSESLLLNILPAEVAEELKEKGRAGAKMFDNVTVLFTDFKSFTTVSEKLTPQQLVNELNVCFSAFDAIMEKYNIEKIKTVGDAYLAVSGLPLARTDHAVCVIKAAIDIRDFIKDRRQKLGNQTFDIRIGVHSGSVVAGIVGIKKFAYDIWGDTVNTAARMEQNSEAGKINISETTYQLVKDKFHFTYRGELEAKNKGRLRMYFVED